MNSVYLISFSIGKNYQDELECDVISLDGCHILLGRPWMFGIKVIDNGYLTPIPFLKEVKRSP